MCGMLCGLAVLFLMQKNVCYGKLSEKCGCGKMSSVKN